MLPREGIVQAPHVEDRRLVRQEQRPPDQGAPCLDRRTTPGEREKTLQTVALDIYNLLTMFKDNEKVGGMQAFQLLSRLSSKECEVETTHYPEHRQEAPKVNVKVVVPKKASSKSLHNLSDLEATYSIYKGQEYHI
jgi:hypothetical protein